MKRYIAGALGILMLAACAGCSQRGKQDSRGSAVPELPRTVPAQGVAVGETAQLAGETESKGRLPLTVNGPVMSIPVGKEIIVDLNGDGTVDTLYYDIQPAVQVEEAWGWAKPISFAVNGQGFIDSSQNNPFKSYNLWIENPDMETYYLVDLDERDNFLEIALTDWASNGCLTTWLFRYDGGKLKSLGCVPGFPDSEDTLYCGDGTVKAAGQLAVMQKWSGVRTYVLEGDSMISQEGEFFQPIDTGRQITLKRRLTVYVKPDLSAETRVLTPSGDVLGFPMTDGAHWVQIRCGDGASGWAYFPAYAAVLNDGEKMDDNEVFDNLLFAG